MKIKRYLSIIGIFILIWILLKLDIGNVFNRIISLNLGIIALLLFLRVLYILFKSISWKYLLSIEGIKYDLTDSFMVYSIGIFLGFITPGRVGELVKVAYLRKDKTDVVGSFVAVFVDRILDVTVLVGLGYISMFFFIGFFRSQLFWISIIIGVISLVLIFLILQKKFFKKIMSVLFKMFGRDELKVGFFDVCKRILKIDKKKMIVPLILVFMAWLVFFFQLYIAAIALGISISFGYVIVSMSIAGLIALVPISFSGIGTRDAALILLFSFISVGKELAVSFSFIALFLMIFAAFVGGFFWLARPLPISTKS